MGREIVEDHDIARFQGWGELGLDIGLEHLPVHRTIDDKGGHQAIVTQASDECLRLPMSEGHRGFQPRPFGGAAPQTGHFGIGSGLVEEHQTMGLAPHQRLAALNPLLAQQPDIRPHLLGRDQSFFYRSAPVPVETGQGWKDGFERLARPVLWLNRPGRYPEPA